MTLQPKKGTAPFADIEFLLSDHKTTRGITLDADLVRTGQYEANKQILKAGTPIGEVTATGLHGPVKKTTLAANVAAGAANSTLTDARFFQVGDTILIDAEAVTITSINYDTRVIGHAALAGAHNAGVTVREDNGLETAVGILTQSVDLTDGDVAAAVVTHAVVREVRILGINALIKADLPKVEFR